MDTIASTKTLDEWINSSGHRNARRVADWSRDAKSTTARTYWALVIAGDYDQSKRAASKARPKVKARTGRRKIADCVLWVFALYSSTA